VHPTYYDPAGRVVLEALSVGLPVIVTRWDGAAEFIQGTEAGRLLDEPTDTEAFAYAMERFCDPEERVKARASIRSHELSRKVSTARHVDEMMAIYAEVAAGRDADATGTGGKPASGRVRVPDASPLRAGGSRDE
jgi:UDP-glucose:(heptosyl)LPS alpha-1,3-glucosyltransferase